MTGPDHYREAERLLAACAGPQRGSALDVACAAAAQVHATLALAAATALKGGFADQTESSHGRTYMSWRNVAGPEPEEIP